MKLNRLDSTTQQVSREAVVRARHVAGEQVRRVEAPEGVEGDRQRSLQQELAEFDPRAIGPFEGNAHILQDAHDLAQQLSSLGPALDALIKPESLAVARPGVDEAA